MIKLYAQYSSGTSLNKGAGCAVPGQKKEADIRVRNRNIIALFLLILLSFLISYGGNNYQKNTLTLRGSQVENYLWKRPRFSSPN